MKVYFRGSRSAQATRKEHRLGGLNNRHLFLSVLATEKYKVGFLYPGGWVLGEGPLPALQIAAFLLYPHMGDKEGASSLVRALIPSQGFCLPDFI